MDPELIIQFLETGGIVAVLGLNFYFFMSGKLISRAMHDEILEVYQKELVKLTNGLSESLEAISESQEEMLEYLKRMNGK